MASKEDIRKQAKALAVGMAQGATAGLGNRGLARTRAALGNLPYEQYLAQQDAEIAALRQANPGTYATGEALGSIAPLAAGGAGLANAGIRGIPNAALATGLYTGVNETQQPDATWGSTLKAGAQGAGLGALAGALTSGVGGAYRGAVNRELQGSANELAALNDARTSYSTFDPITKEPQIAYSVNPGAVNQLATKDFMNEVRSSGQSLGDMPYGGMKRLREIQGDTNRAMTQYPAGSINPQHAILSRPESEITMNTLRDPRYAALPDRYTPMNMMANRAAQSEVAKAEARLGGRMTSPAITEMSPTALETQYGGTLGGALNTGYDGTMNQMPSAPSASYSDVAAGGQIGDRLRAALAKYNSTK